MKKRLLVLLLLMFCIYSIVGCQNLKPTDGNKNSSTPQPTFPEKPITIIVPANAGGSADLIARAITNYSEKHFGQTMVAENVPGGSTSIGTSKVVHAKADGYTLLIGTAGGVTCQPLYGQVDYTSTDLEPLAMVSEESIVLLVPKNTFKSLEELIDYGKKNPGKIVSGNPAAGGPLDLAVQKLFTLAGVTAETISYKGSADEKAALMGGHISCGVMHPMEALPLIKSGDVVPLAVSVSGTEREPALPEVATFQELGYDIHFTVWKGIYGPKGMPEYVKNILIEKIDTIIHDEGLVKEINNMGQSVTYKNPADFAKYMASEDEVYKGVIAGMAVK